VGRTSLPKFFHPSRRRSHDHLQKLHPAIAAVLVVSYLGQEEKGRRKRRRIGTFQVLSHGPVKMNLDIASLGLFLSLLKTMSMLMDMSTSQGVGNARVLREILMEFLPTWA